MNEFVTVFEMGPRDGLQNEKTIISTKDKIALIDQLSACGLSKIETTSFVSPKWVPQMADAREVMAGITRKPGVSYTALTPNMRGFEAAITAKADEIAVFASASEGFSQKNINCSIADSLERFVPILKLAKTAMIPVRGYVSCITDCPYDGPTPPSAVVDVTSSLFDMGCYEVSLGDTLGSATPDAMLPLLKCLSSEFDSKWLAGHFHDTQGFALDNIGLSVEFGLRVFDSAIGGLGGCPYAPGAKGNVATELVVEALHKIGFETGVDLQELLKVRNFAQNLRTAHAI